MCSHLKTPRWFLSRTTNLSSKIRRREMYVFVFKKQKTTQTKPSSLKIIKGQMFQLLTFIQSSLILIKQPSFDHSIWKLIKNHKKKPNKHIISTMFDFGGTKPFKDYTIFMLILQKKKHISYKNKFKIFFYCFYYLKITKYQYLSDKTRLKIILLLCLLLGKKKNTFFICK